MADIFRRLEDYKTGKGGVLCDCCNWTRCKHSANGKRRAKIQLKKMIRQILKRDLRQQIL
jgi:hypothetical protein